VTLVAPTRTDPVAGSASRFLGGPLGRWAVAGGSPGRALQIVLLVGTVTFVLGALRTIPCARAGWPEPQRMMWLCYSDIPVLYRTRGLWDGSLPYLSTSGNHPFEYPVLTGLFAWLAQLGVGPNQAQLYYWVTVAMLLACFLVALAATAMTVRHRVWDGLLLALAPSVIFASTINWDWFAIALTSLALLAWSRSRPLLAGVLLGLAIAAKFYPVLILGPLALLCFRRRRMPAFWQTAGAAAAAWLVVNLPFAVLAPEGWSYFFTFSQERGQDFGSLWLALGILGVGVSPVALNAAATVSLLALCAGIAVLILTAPRPPRIAQVAFLVVAAFLVTNKVYSPQFVLWLLPLAVLARPRWRDFLIWQAGELVYFVAVWWYIVEMQPDSKGLEPRAYAVTILIHIACTGWLAAMVVRDALRPGGDPVRSDPVWSGQSAVEVAAFDDPGGGVLDGAPDRMRPAADVAGGGGTRAAARVEVATG
jgi:hypothetical protein